MRSKENKQVGSKRLFVGIKMPNKINEEIQKAKAKLEVEVPGRWLPPQNWHVTLKFLGSCSIDMLSEISDALRKVVGKNSTFFTKVTDFGCFPSQKYARVFWLGLETSSSFEQLQSDTESSLENLGFPSENRSFHPHVTLVRFKKPARINCETINELATVKGTVQVKEITLFESVLTPQGATYLKLENFKLKGLTRTNVRDK